MPHDVRYDRLVEAPAQGYERPLILSFYLAPCRNYVRIRFTIASNGQVLFVLRDLLSIVAPYTVDSDGKVKMGGKLRAEICAMCGTTMIPKVNIYSDASTPTTMNAIDFSTMTELIKRYGQNTAANELRKLLMNGIIRQSVENALPVGYKFELGGASMRKIECPLNRPILLQRLEIEVRQDCAAVSIPGAIPVVGISISPTEKIPATNSAADEFVEASFGLKRKYKPKPLAVADPLKVAAPKVSEEAADLEPVEPEKVVLPDYMIEPDYMKDTPYIQALEAMSRSKVSLAKQTSKIKLAKQAQQAQLKHPKPGTIVVTFADKTQTILRFGIKDKRLYFALADLTLTLHPFLGGAELEIALLPWVRRVCNGNIPYVEQFEVGSRAMPMVPYVKLAEFLSQSRVARAVELRRLVEIHAIAARASLQVPDSVEVDIRNDLPKIQVRKAVKEINSITVPIRSKGVEQALARMQAKQHEETEMRKAARTKGAGKLTASSIWAAACAQYGLNNQEEAH